MSLLKTYGISAVIGAILFGLSLLIYKQIESFLSHEQTKEKEIKQRRVIQDKKTLFNRIMISFFSASLAVVIAAPVPYINEIIFRFLFGFHIKGNIAQFTAIFYLSIGIVIYFLLVIFIFKWLKKNLDSVWDKMKVKK